MKDTRKLVQISIEDLESPDYFQRFKVIMSEKDTNDLLRRTCKAVKEPAPYLSS